MLKLIALTTLVLMLGAPVGRADSVDRDHADVRGNAVSDCNHRANLQQLQGQERKDFVDWCTSRVDEVNDENDRYGECYARMSDPRLSDTSRSPRNCSGRMAYHMQRS